MKVIIIVICCCLMLHAEAQRCVVKPENIKATASPLSATSAVADDQAATRDTLKNEVIVIPVVFHIIYHNSIQNITDAQVLSQLAVLNNDYRRLNADAVNTPAAFKNIAADTRISFCLAKVDPAGRHTSGIIHKYTGEDLFLSDDAMKVSASGGDDAWDSKRYLNIWVCNLFGRTLGYGVLPGGDAAKDGVVIQYTAFGATPNVAAPFNKGRTATHEVGHWLGLRHLWGDGVCGDDGIADTPPQQASNSNCPSFPHLSSCSNNSYGDLFMNYMDFTDDACMNMFTQGQKSEMRSQFARGGYRNSFLNAAVCDSSLARGAALPEDNGPVTADINVYPNPFSSQVTISYKNTADLKGVTAKIYDVTGKQFYSVTITSQITTVSLTGIPSGLYFLKIDGGNKPQVFKLLKQPSGGTR